jgi:hypothetical protein
MWSETSIPPTTDNTRYIINVSNFQSDDKIMGMPVLTVEGEFSFKVEEEDIPKIMCMDVAVFLNRDLQGLCHVATTAPKQSANFTRDCSESPITLALGKGLCFVAVFSLRNKSQKLEPETMSCPSWLELRGVLALGN